MKDNKLHQYQMGSTSDEDPFLLVKMTKFKHVPKKSRNKQSSRIQCASSTAKKKKMKENEL